MRAIGSVVIVSLRELTFFQASFVAARHRLLIECDTEARAGGNGDDAIFRHRRTLIADIVGIPTKESLTGFADMFHGRRNLEVSRARDTSLSAMEPEADIELFTGPNELDGTGNAAHFD